MLRAALIILAKDLKLRLRDRSVLLFAIVVPLGLTALFSVVLPDADELELAAAVIDEDGGAVARGFVDGFLPAVVDQGLLELVEVRDEAAARAAVADGTIDAAWVIPAGLSADVGSGRATELTVLVSAGQAIPGEIARGLAATYAEQIDQVGLAVATVAAVSDTAPTEQDVAAIAQLASSQPSIVELRDETRTGGGQLDSTSHLAAGMAAFFVFFVAQFGVTGLLEERQQQTMPRLLAAPIRPAAIQLGKIGGAFLLGIASMAVLVLASSGLLGADWGPTPGVVVLVVAIVLAALGILALVGSFAKTAEQAGNLQSTVAVVLGLLGGVFFPVPGDAALLRFASSLSPHGWFLRGLSASKASGDWTSVLPAAAAIVAFGVVAAIPAVVRHRRASSW